ncbi:ABC transporter permease [Paenibacillus sp. 1011MAR3C5]|uniref:ABC transporter permease n=1 Tax=Paenibacillus sp. 1011MAR3C5 TaxID=1675787 RepID=UPI000E6CC3F0|nr:ABC transporter permease [Paenibacillus sp. 1011MAR3C5]RJE87755.1 ABC transporter permease [Paenibacillus sp. 1011MAR3C5]
MTFSMKRVCAILQKDYKDMSRNLYVSTTLFLPLIMAAVFGRMGIETLESHYMIINMAFILVGTYVQSSLIAEEKEKNTLRGLMLSPASTLEIFFGKNLLSFIATVVIVILSILLAEYDPGNIPVVAVALLLSTVFYLGLGTLIGMFTKSVIEASVIIVPVMAVFSFGSFLKPFIENYPILSVIEYMPNMQLLDLAAQVEAGAGFGDVWSNLLIIVGWIIVIHMLAVYSYKKRMVEE